MTSKGSEVEFEQTGTVEFSLGKKKKYKITISNNPDLIQFKIEDLVSYSDNEYFYESNLEDLQKFNRFFFLFSDLQECNQNIIKLVKNKENINVKIENNICKFIIKNQINDDEIILELTKKDTEGKEQNNEDIKDSIPLLGELKKKLDELEEKNENLENKHKELEKKVENLEKNIENINQKFEGNAPIKLRAPKAKEETEEDEIDYGKQMFKSNIIDKKEEKVIYNWIKSKIVSTDLIYDTTTDGDSIDAFKEKCNGKCPTLVIIKTDTGIVFGGYTTSPWKENGPIPDNNAFVYSLNPNKKYPVKMPKYALLGYKPKEKILFQFGCCCFRIEDNCTKTNNNCIVGSGYERGLVDLIQGDHKFRVSRIEIFKLNF